MHETRAALAALLTAGLPGDVDVEPYAHAITTPTNSTVMIQLDGARPSPAGQGLRTYDVTLIVVGKLTTYGPADDELDGVMELVQEALVANDTPAGVVWVETRRSAYQETNPQYEVTLSVTMERETE